MTTELPYAEAGPTRPDDPALLLRIEQDGRNSMRGCMAPADIPALLRQIAGNIEVQLGQTPAPGALPTPSVGDRYVHRTRPSRTVTVSSVWTDDDGDTAVSFEWGDRGQCGSACPLSMFHDTYQPAQQAAAAPATITSAAAAHVLWQEDAGGYPAGSFTTALLKAWWLADTSNAAALSQVFPAYGAAIGMLRTQGGIDRLRRIAGGDQA